MESLELFSGGFSVFGGESPNLGIGNGQNLVGKEETPGCYEVLPVTPRDSEIRRRIGEKFPELGFSFAPTGLGAEIEKRSADVE